MSSKPTVEGYGKYVLGRMETIHESEEGETIVFEVLNMGPTAAVIIEEEFGELSELSRLMLVPDCITVEMPWDTREHIFHVSQIMAVVTA